MATPSIYLNGVYLHRLADGLTPGEYYVLTVQNSRAHIIVYCKQCTS